MLASCPDAEVDTVPREHTMLELAISPASVVGVATRTVATASVDIVIVVEAPTNIVVGV